MIENTETTLSWGLTRGMARVLDVNLPEAVLDGWLSRRDLVTMVDRCTACTQKTACTAWLAKVVSSRHAAPFCGNRAELEALSPHH